MIMKRQVPPGEESQIKVSFLAGYNDRFYEQDLKIVTNDPDNELIIIKLLAYVDVIFSVEPRILNLGNVPSHKGSKTWYLKLVGRDYRKYKILSAQSDNDFLQITIQPVEKRIYPRIAVRLKKGIPIGIFKDKIQVFTSNPEKPTMEISVQAKIIGNVEVSPAVVRFYVSPLETIPPQQITIKHSNSALFNIFKIDFLDKDVGVTEYLYHPANSDSDMEFDYEMLDKGDGKSIIWLHLIKPPKPRLLIRGKIRLMTNDPSQEEIVIPYKVQTRNKRYVHINAMSTVLDTRKEIILHNFDGSEFKVFTIENVDIPRSELLLKNMNNLVVGRIEEDLAIDIEQGAQQYEKKMILTLKRHLKPGEKLLNRFKIVTDIPGYEEVLFEINATCSL
ncbi:hypothetical protein ACFL27_06660 [candidate division CSSED10-310 bacterium]|uniref:DUF4139 domain-containing protein n=1 Tax=candidate division CSSED10-310 bacterium TaxID=2855610 RepID=A0ABV6YUI6_UNCC1